MAEGRKVGLRQKAIPIDKKLKIVRDISFYTNQNINSEGIAGEEVVINYENFVNNQIHIPGIQKGEKNDATKQGAESPEDKEMKHDSKSNLVDASLASMKTNVE